MKHEPVSIDHPIGRRVVVWGRPGKTTLGKAIAQDRKLPFIEVDWVRFKPNWELRSDDEANAIIEAQVAKAREGWVYDGNPRYCESMMATADTVILIDLPWLTSVWTYLKRGVRRSWTGSEIAGGNKETFRLNFASKESHLCYIIRSRNRDFRAELEPQIPKGAAYFVINSWKQLHRFYDLHDLPTVPSIDSREAAAPWFDA